MLRWKFLRTGPRSIGPTGIACKWFVSNSAAGDLLSEGVKSFRLITENTCDGIRPAEDLWPPGALHVDARMLDARVVDEHVDASEFARRMLDQHRGVGCRQIRTRETRCEISGLT
jgi:hypothetical protein